MKKRFLSLALCLLMVLALLPTAAFAISDENNGDWSSENVILKNTAEAELMVRVGDIDACNDPDAFSNEECMYKPFTATSQYSHGFPWGEDENDSTGTDRIYLGSLFTTGGKDGYAGCFEEWQNGGTIDTYNPDTEETVDLPIAAASGAAAITMNYSTSDLTVRNAILQLCVDDFQTLTWQTHFKVTINGKDAPFASEVLNHIDQTGPVANLVSFELPDTFLTEVKSGKLVIEIDETTGLGDGYAIDFAKLLVNCNENVLKQGTITGIVYDDMTEAPLAGATVRLLGTSTTVITTTGGNYTFDKVAPGLGAVRASKSGYVEDYGFNVVVSGKTTYFDTDMSGKLSLVSGTGSKDIDFSQFATVESWSNASGWAVPELRKASEFGLIPDCLINQDLTKSITRAEFAAITVKVYESLTGKSATSVSDNPFTDTSDPEVLKAYNIGAVNGTSATTYAPNNLLNREQASTMLTRVYKAYSIEGWTLATDGQFSLSYTKPADFADDANISSWAKDSVYFMASNGVINGVGSNKFAPKNITPSETAIGYANATREQALLIAIRIVEKLGPHN